MKEAGIFLHRKEIAFKKKPELINFVHIKAGMKLLKRAGLGDQTCLWSWLSCTTKCASEWSTDILLKKDKFKLVLPINQNGIFD